MASKRAWKLQDFNAHGANVNCLALGNKSGRVLVTGGDDKKVNLWAVGKQNCIMSLSGHTTPVECVTFGHSEELVCAGSMSGALKIWDLEQAKIVRTLTGHKANIRCLDFHPYGEFLASGSVDTNIKLWDIRRKGCIFTYKGHRHVVNSLKFSPDGRWIASGGEDGVVKLWDLQSGKMLAEFSNHTAPVNDVQFHPNEFLLASGSSDKTVKFWDLESFQLVSTTDADSSAIRCIYFNPDGECLFSGAQDSLKVYGWEPARIHDTLQIGWGKVAGISTTHSQLIAATYHLNSVSVYVVDLKRLQPFSGALNHQGTTTTGSFQYSSPMRKSFIRRPPTLSTANTQVIPVKMVEDSESSTPDVDLEDDSLSLADIKEVEDYKAIFQPRRRELCRTPPKTGDLFSEPFEAEPVKQQPIRKFEPPQLESQLDPVRTEIVKPEPIRPEPMSGLEIKRLNHSKQPPVSYESIKSETFRVERQFHIESARTEIVRHVTVGSQSRSDPLRLDPVEPLVPRGAPVVHTSIVKKMDNKSEIISTMKPTILSKKTTDYLSDKEEKCDFVPTQRDRSVGLDVDEFLPLNLKRFNDTLRFSGQQQPEMSEAEAISSIIKGHESMVAVLTNRQRNLQIVYTIWANKDLKTAMDSAVHMNDMSVIADIVSTISFKPSIWSLDLCVTLLPSIYELVQSKYETYMTVGCVALRLVLKNFASVIRSNIAAPSTIGIDLSREERYNKCMSCYNQLMSIRAFILKRQTLQGKLGHTFRELHTLLQTLD